MSNTFGFVSEDTFAAKMDEQNALLAAIAANGGDSLRPVNWQGVQAIVRAGLANKVFEIGNQFVCKKGNDTLVWDVIGFDYETPVDRSLTHSMTLQLHKVYKKLQFDEREAFFYAQNGLPAGTYYFTVGYNTWYAGDQGVTVYFTTTQDIPEKGQIVFDQNVGVSIPDGSVSTYASATSTNPIETGLPLNRGSRGSQLTPGDNIIENTLSHANVGFNSMDRALAGNSNYKQSAIRQFVNSELPAGRFWTNQNVWDRPPQWVSTENGFLYDLDEEFVSVIGKVEKITDKDTICDGGGTYTTKDKFFLISREEVYAKKEIEDAGGTAYPYYRMYSDIPEPTTDPDTNRLKYTNSGAVSIWALRTPNISTDFYIRIIDGIGHLTSSHAYGEHGIAPACAIV